MAGSPKPSVRLEGALDLGQPGFRGALRFKSKYWVQKGDKLFYYPSAHAMRKACEQWVQQPVGKGAVPIV